MVDLYSTMKKQKKTTMKQKVPLRLHNDLEISRLQGDVVTMEKEILELRKLLVEKEMQFAKMETDIREEVALEVAEQLEEMEQMHQAHMNEQAHIHEKDRDRQGLPRQGAERFVDNSGNTSIGEKKAPGGLGPLNCEDCCSGRE